MCKEEEKTTQLKEFGQKDQQGQYYQEYEWCDGQTKFWEICGDLIPNQECLKTGINGWRGQILLEIVWPQE